MASGDGAQAPVNDSPLLDDYFNEAEMAAEIRSSRPTLRRWRLLKIGPPVTKFGRKVLYKKSSARAWLASREARP